jgi:hypothetical protein
MDPPKWVLDKIEEVHSLCRLGYDDDEPNEFAVLELWRVREAPETIMGYPYRGHIYGSPYDPLERVALHLMSVPFLSVFDGSVIDMLKRAVLPFHEKSRAALLKEGEEVEQQITAMAEEMGDRAWFESHKTGAPRGPIVPNKEITEEDKSIIRGDWAEQHSQKESFLPQPLPGAKPIK